MHRTRLVAAAFSAALAAVLAATPAFAAPVDAAAPLAAAAPSGAGTDVAPDLIPVFDARRNVSARVEPAVAAGIIRAYWTKAKLMAAIPATAPGDGTGSRQAPDSSAKSKVLAAPVAPKVASGANRVAFTHADGKVFFRDPVDGLNKACSAGTVNSGKRRLVVTAGHCVHGGSGRQWMENWVFYPGYQSGQGPAGAFPAWQPWAKTAWTNSSDFSYDYAIVITQTNALGERLVDRVGGNGLIVNPGRPFVTAIAYPSNYQNGEQQAFCQGTLSRRNILNADQQLNCDLRFGASGGPWLRDYSDATTLGSIVSNQSYSLNADGSGPEYGPYYDSEMTSLYNSAETASP